MQAASSGAHASSATLWPKLEPIQVALQFGTNATGILLAGEITQLKEAIPWVRCASGNVFYFSFNNFILLVILVQNLLHVILAQ